MKILGRTDVFAVLLIIATSVISPASASADPLVTREDARLILGDTVAEPREKATQSGMAPPGLRYSYSITGSTGDPGNVGSMVIHLYDKETMAGDDGLYSSAQDYYDRRKKATINAEKRSGRIELEEVEGVGDTAYWAPSSDTLHFMSNSAYVTVKINDLKKMSGADRAELDSKTSVHRRQLAEKIAGLIVPNLEAP